MSAYFSLSNPLEYSHTTVSTFIWFVPLQIPTEILQFYVQIQIILSPNTFVKEF